MGTADPTYPLYPIACILAAFMLLVVLLTSFIRQNWNLGVTFLCFWLFLESFSGAVNTIIWSDNTDIRYYVYCDIVSHLGMITYVVKPMATLIITRRLYLIANLQSVQLPSKAARRRNLAVEWTLGLFVPLLVAGPIYYVHQGYRFEVTEAFGCTDNVQVSILELLTLESWTVMPPLVSVVFYYPRVIRIFYRQRRDTHSFLNSNTSISCTNYLRILALASVDILLTLPIGIGWTFLHTDWEPVSFSYANIKAGGPAELAQNYFPHWSSPVLAFVIFGLFGVTSEARASYWRIICSIGGWVGWKPTPRTRNGQQSLGEIEFGARPQDMSFGDVEMGSRRPNFVTPEALTIKQDAEHAPDQSVPRPSSSSNKEAHQSLSQNREGEHRVHASGTSNGTVAAVDV